MFDFLGDQPDEEQQQHTESAEREAFDESARLREMLPPDTASAEPKPPAMRSAAPSPTPAEKPHPPPKKGLVKGVSGGSRPKPLSRAMLNMNVSSSEARQAPPKHGVKGAKSMGPRLVSRKGPPSKQKGHKKLVNDSKIFQDFPCKFSLCSLITVSRGDDNVAPRIPVHFLAAVRYKGRSFS